MEAMAQVGERDKHGIAPYCALCGNFQSLHSCAACQTTWYCCDEHQPSHWQEHKIICKQIRGARGIDTSSSPCSPADVSTSHVSVIPGSVPNRLPNVQIASSSSHWCGHPNCFGVCLYDMTSTTTEQQLPVTMNPVQCISSPPFLEHNVDLAMLSEESARMQPSEMDGMPSLQEMHKIDNDVVNQFHNPIPQPPELLFEPDESSVLVQYVIDNMRKYGICVVDKFLGPQRGCRILEEVQTLHKSGVLRDGLLVNQTKNSSRIRGDKIVWLDGSEDGCANISYLISRMDGIISPLNLAFPQYDINGRTKAMVACYPGRGSGYVKHVDNPNCDGRIITCIYYLNKNWRAKELGGLLRIYPESQNRIAEVEPLFDRLLFFWSDRRNPHEVCPAYDTRYAVTVWYFDEQERMKALSRFQKTGMKKQR